MSSDQDQVTGPHFSPDGRWWWDGAGWQPVAGSDHRRRTTWVWVLVAVTAVVGALIAGVLLLAALTGPVGQQHDTDELGGDYCAYFPEEC